MVNNTVPNPELVQGVYELTRAELFKVALFDFNDAGGV